MVDSNLEPVTPELHAAVGRLWQLYSHDLSEFRGTKPDAEGRYRAGRLPSYLEDPDRCAYLIRHEAALAGFACVRGLSEESRVMGEFFVVRGVRRQRVGHAAAVQVLKQYPGPWAVPFQEENPGAAKFWRRVATDSVGPTWTEERRSVRGKPDVPPDTWLLLKI